MMDLQEAKAVLSLIKHSIPSPQTADTVVFLTGRAQAVMRAHGCVRCGELGIEDASEHAERTEHWPARPHAPLPGNSTCRCPACQLQDRSA